MQHIYIFATSPPPRRACTRSEPGSAGEGFFFFCLFSFLFF